MTRYAASNSKFILIELKQLKKGVTTMSKVSKILTYVFGAFENHVQSVTGRDMNVYAILQNRDGKGPEGLPKTNNWLIVCNDADNDGVPMEVTDAELASAFWRYIRGKKGSPKK